MKGFWIGAIVGAVIGAGCIGYTSQERIAELKESHRVSTNEIMEGWGRAEKTGMKLAANAMTFAALSHSIAKYAGMTDAEYNKAVDDRLDAHADSKQWQQAARDLYIQRSKEEGRTK